MATKKTVDKKTHKSDAAPVRTAAPAHTAAFDQALVDFAAALELTRKDDWAAAGERFRELDARLSGEPVLAERARVWGRICERKLSPGAPAPKDADERFYRAVVLNNQGRSDEAIRLLDEAIQERPADPRLLYVRASAWAVKGNADAALSDLRQAIAAEPQIRFQAGNDPDFENIREEPAFIDIIEPTPAGA